MTKILSRTARTDAAAPPLPVLLAGSPNVGKSTLFAALSGHRAQTGNREGVTVEAVHVTVRLRAPDGPPRDVMLTDLPGIRTLPPAAPDEQISVRALEQAPTGAVGLFTADAVRLADGLSLFFALRQQVDAARRRSGRHPLRWVLAVNGCDRLTAPAEPGPSAGSRRTDRISDVLDEAALTRLAGVPAVGVSALRRTGLRALTAALLTSGMEAACRPCGPVETDTRPTACAGCPAGCAARAAEPATRSVRLSAAEIASAVLLGSAPPPSPARQRIDRLLCRPATGVPILFCLWGLLMVLAFGPPGNALCAVCERGLSPAAARLTSATARLPAFLSSLLSEGLLGGLGAVLSCLPRLLILWVGMALLEETGVLPRAARLSDPFMRRLGLGGEALIPLLLGFGCTVPAVMATRTIADADTRNAVIRLSPLITCSARMPLFSLLAESFFARSAPGAPPDGWRTLLFCSGLYALSAVMTLGTAAMAQAFRHRASALPTPAVRPLPPLRLPSPWIVLSETADRLRRFILRVAGVILLSSLLVWLLLHTDARFNWMPVPDTGCLLFRLGRSVGVLLKPLGLGHPAIAAALLAGVGAKESVVSVLGICLSASGNTLPAALASSGWLTPASALSLAVFSAFYLPCTAALGSMSSEWTGRKSRILPALMGAFAIAYGAAYMTFAIGRLFLPTA